MGARALMLDLLRERELLGYGVSTCATCDGFFFRGQDIAVVGGGDSALEEAIFLTKFAESVTLVHRRGELRGSKIMQDRALANPKVKFAWNSVVSELLGADKLEGVKLRDVRTGEERVLDIGGLFVAIGHVPSSDILRGQLDLDAAGDLVDHRYRQAVTAAGTGCMAAIDVERWLESHEDSSVPVESAP
jgi:thioredoxin reductase (NADPH)